MATANEKIDQTENPENKKAPKKLSFYLKIFLAIILIIAAIASIAVYKIQKELNSGSGKITDMIKASVKEAAGLDLAFDGIKVKFPTISVINCKLATETIDYKLQAAISQIDLNLQWMKLFKKELAVKSLYIGNSSLEGEIAEAKGLALLVKGEESKPKTDKSEFKADIDKVKLEKLALNIKDRKSGKVWKGELKVLLDTPLFSQDLTYDLEGEISELASIKAAGKIAERDKKIDGQVSLQIKDTKFLSEFLEKDKRDYLKLVPYLNGKTAFAYDAKQKSLSLDKTSLETANNLKLALKTDVSSLEPLAMKLQVESSPLQTKDLNIFLKALIEEQLPVSFINGAITLKALIIKEKDKDLAFSGEALPDKLEVSVKEFPLDILLNKAVVKFDDQEAQVSGLDLAIANSKVNSEELTYVYSTSDFKGKLQIALDFDKSWAKLANLAGKDAKDLLIKGSLSSDLQVSGKGSKAAETVKVSGNISSKGLKVSHSKINAQAEFPAISVKLDGIGKNKGKLIISALEAKTSGTSLSASGDLTLAKDISLNTQISGKAVLEELLPVVYPILKLDPKNHKIAGEAKVQAKVTGTVAQPLPQGTFTINKVSVLLPEYGLDFKNVSGTLELDKEKALLKELKGETAKTAISLDGSLSNFKKFNADMKLGIKGADLSDIKQIISKNANFPAEVDLGGKADLSMTLKGEFDKLAVAGEAELMDIFFFHPLTFRKFDKINGKIAFNNKGLSTEEVRANWGTSVLKAKGKIESWSELKTYFDFKAEPLDLTDAAGFFLSDTGLKVTGTGGGGQGKLFGPLTKVRLEAKATVPEGSINAATLEKLPPIKFPYQNMKTDIIYQDGILEISSGTFDIFEGQVAVAGKVFLASEPISYDFKTSLNKIKSERFIGTNFGEERKNMVTGETQGFFNIRGNSAGLSSLDGEGELRISTGTYHMPNIFKTIAAKLNTPEIASGTIENLKGALMLKQGRIYSENAKFATTEGNLGYKGFLGLDGGLDGELSIELSPEICASNEVLKKISPSGGNLKLQAGLKGALMSPSVSFDIENLVKEKAKDSLKGAAKKMLRNFLKKD
ncbi:MAG: hypothetical protein GX221_01745 [Candidatus Riflebacteria bacterium]|nr:hypothetical protein [Candidatus Riflebacteria bacterium]